MSKFPSILNPTEEDMKMLLAAQTHIGTKNSNTGTNAYIFKRRVDGRLLFSIISLISILRYQHTHTKASHPPTFPP